MPQKPADKSEVVGRRIVDFDTRPFDNGRGGTAYDPVIELSDGRRIYFIVTETEVGEYGVTPCMSDPILNRTKRGGPFPRKGQKEKIQ